MAYHGRPGVKKSGLRGSRRGAGPSFSAGALTHARGVLTAYGLGAGHLGGGLRLGFSERWRQLKEDLDAKEKHTGDVRMEVVRAVRCSPEELGKRLGISADGAKELKDMVEFWHVKGLV
ncbi:MAG: hypothetical protein JRN16_08730 [Nitrososphaerota archaeon]|jgi:hypothetical protein|nr:hypothetical protein [Nitrososphaerota archaeon]MDG6959823.1 hypothetical protein [Nitrososphaerota archaeon]MDG6961910.1 hypothetical protein [Nitrososphaerota archaeon]MDG6974146.1 hypothetical protein [Nitrososphaerota archaeon]MDG6987088.1 hypothetical protein [Nitrososphaerota archaeon]